MNAHRMDRETAERLLGGPVVEPQDALRPLVLLLTAARAAPRPGELDGEHAAVQAFRRSLTEPADAPRRSRHTLTGIGVRAGLAALALAATGGVALAATGTLPGGSPEPPAPAPAPSAPAGTGSPGGGSAPEPSRPGTGNAGTPEPSLVGLCRTYRAGAGDNPGRVLDNPAFAALIAAAGGRDRVADHCDRVLSAAETPHGKESRTPSEPASSGATPPTAPPGRPDEPGNSEKTPPPEGRTSDRPVD